MVDISERMLERLDDRAAADGVHNVEPLVADLRRLPLEDECATLVVSNYAFHHLDDQARSSRWPKRGGSSSRVGGWSDLAT